MLFIFESIGTSELILIGIIALIFLGPRKLPEMARKMGKMMAEFRGTATEFKETWQREVDFEEEKKAFSIDDLEGEPVARVNSIPEPEPEPVPDVAPPAIKAIDPASMKDLMPGATDAKMQPETAERVETGGPVDTHDKKNWL